MTLVVGVKPQAVDEKAATAKQEKKTSDIITAEAKLITRKGWIFVLSFFSTFLYLVVSVLLYIRYDNGKEDFEKSLIILFGVIIATLAAFVSFILCILTVFKVSAKQRCRWIAAYTNFAFTYFVWSVYTCVVTPDIFWNYTLRLLGMSGFLLVVNTVCVAEWLLLLRDEEEERTACKWSLILRAEKTKQVFVVGKNNEKKHSNKKHGTTEAIHYDEESKM